jgi:hypothetical protein
MFLTFKQLVNQANNLSANSSVQDTSTLAQMQAKKQSEPPIKSNMSLQESPVKDSLSKIPIENTSGMGMKTVTSFIDDL